MVELSLAPDSVGSKGPAAAISKARLQFAIERGEIYPVFQPIVTLPGGATTGFEVLARWRHPELGEIAPLHFIPIAVQTGLIGPLMERLMDAACASALAWDDGLQLSFNISPVQLMDSALPRQIENAVGRTGFPPGRIQLELTESELIDDLDSARRLMNQLKEPGFQIALDDFGTGFSCFIWLQELPLDLIKVDARFVQSMPTSCISCKIVAAIIGLGRSLKMPVIAEGIETPAAALMLARLGCELGQGYWYGRPQTAEVVAAISNSPRRRAYQIGSLDLTCNPYFSGTDNLN